MGSAVYGLLMEAIVILANGISRMYLCYIDESGDSGKLNPGNETDTPAYVVVGLVIEQALLRDITNDFLSIKRVFYPREMSTEYPLNDILYEVKGESIRKLIRKGNRRNFSHAIGYLDAIVSLLGRYSALLFAKGLVKGVDVENSDSGFYGSAIQHIGKHFHHLISEKRTQGMIIADSRRQVQNSRVAHTMFTQLFGAQHYRYTKLMELPTYAHSQNHAMIQIADIVCSSIVFPMIVDVYCGGLNNVHVTPKYASLRCRYKESIKAMQYRYFEDSRWQGGVLVTDGSGAGRRTSALFR